MNIMALPGQTTIEKIDNGIRKLYLVLNVDQLMILKEQEPHRLVQIDGEWCVRVERLH